ncbi:ABC transporter ATP-binding protein [Ructibacterium gallinarum]|uniref:ABC transporter ATP-binding protein n=1 Tax=Ructibacterium gallinarum TaxID=2779355 RepID=A0A9D5LYP0_9FIRM|nr:ABC transporter ATP-binding protein [Ructibacterium gallinarum]MBE5038955.1 ABC transporter ATP-binding protein [Ructibacterium gallinarum]
MPPAHKNMGMKKPKNAKGTLFRILSYLSPYKWQLIIVVIAVIISSGAGVAGTYFLKPIVDDYIVPLIGAQNPNFSGLLHIVLLLAIIYVAGAACTYIYNRVMVNVAAGSLYRMRMDMFTHMQKLPIRYFDTRTHGEIMSRYTNDIDTLRNMMSQSVPQLISSAITVIGVFVMMLILSVPLTILVVLMMLTIFWVIKKVGGKSSMYYRSQQSAIGVVNGYIEEMIEGQRVVKVFCHEEESKKNFDVINEDLCTASTRANTFASILMPIMNNLSYVHYALTAVIGASLAILSGQRDLGFFSLGLGALISFLQYTRSFAQPITQVSQQFNVILNALAGAERIFALLDEKPEVDDGYVTLVDAVIDEDGTVHEADHHTGQWAWKHPHSDGTLTYTPVRGAVEFENVEFGYEPDKVVLHGISLYAKPGQKIAFVGSTGAGKTTITNLINRFYDVPDGKIRYDGININKIKKADLRRSLSMVLQDTHLFTGTVMDNIRYGNLQATDEEVIAAAKLANADWFIRHLPQGYDTVLTGDGSNLSQGQRQLLAIARAAVADPPVLILDEATSSIDTRTEALIEKGMDRLMEGRTVFVIAHRLSTVRNSHAIMVLEHGVIIERGSHDQLIAQRGKYYQLYTGMFELS